MFQEYYKFKAKYYSDELHRFNKEKLKELNNFNDAVKKYKKFKAIYDKAAYYINKLPNGGYITSFDYIYNQIESKLNGLFNHCVIESLKSHSESDCLNKLRDIENDLNTSYGYRFDNYIMKYNQSLQEIIRKHNIIYKNYKSNLKIIDSATLDCYLIDSIVRHNSDYILEREIDFVSLYGTDYESYVEMAQSYFDEKGLKIKFNKTKRIDKSKLNNLLFTNTSSEDIEKLVNYILSMSVPNELKLLLIDYSQINLFEYNGLSNLYAPVISDYKTAKISLDLIIKTEMNRRYDLFLEKRVKSIDLYNNNVDADYKLPYILIVINELFEMLKFENTRDIIFELLSNCKTAGIIIICFSKFNKKNIQLKMLEDLFEVHTGYSNNYLDSDTKNESSEIDDIDNDMNGLDFEKYAGNLLKANGFTKVEVTQNSNDFGVDVIAYKDDIKYAIQCKKYSSPVGIKAVQEVIGSKAMNDCHVAVVLTNNTFTKSAIDLAEKNNVLLWGRDKLTELIEKCRNCRFYTL